MASRGDDVSLVKAYGLNSNLTHAQTRQALELTCSLWECNRRCSGPPYKPLVYVMPDFEIAERLAREIMAEDTFGHVARGKLKYFVHVEHDARGEIPDHLRPRLDGLSIDAWLQQADRSNHKTCEIVVVTTREALQEIPEWAARYEAQWENLAKGWGKQR
ncbi:hypothetical protein BDP81DRAFT_432196, partial [Colletotrichum phormii]